MDQLKRRGYALANRCFICEEVKETIDHLQLHCSKARMLWDIIFSLVRVRFFLEKLEKHFFVGMVILWARSGKRLGWQPLYAIFRLFGVKGTKLHLTMK